MSRTDDIYRFQSAALAQTGSVKFALSSRSGADFIPQYLHLMTDLSLMTIVLIRLQASCVTSVNPDALRHHAGR